MVENCWSIIIQHNLESAPCCLISDVQGRTVLRFNMDVYRVVTENPNVSDLGMFHPTFCAKAAPKMLPLEPHSDLSIVAEFQEKIQKIWEGEKKIEIDQNMDVVPAFYEEGRWNFMNFP